MSKRRRKRQKRSLSQTVVLIMSGMIAASMVISLIIVALPGPRDAAPTPPREEVRETTVQSRTISIAPVYFDLDKSTIKSEYQSILQSAAGALRDTGVSVTIEGHCDERGSEEYNLALGERRANAVRRYLLDLGVASSQLTTVSYGEARPAVNGTGETAWQLNRRAQFTVR